MGLLRKSILKFNEDYLNKTEIVRNGDCNNKLDILVQKNVVLEAYLMFYNGSKISEIFYSIDEIENFLNKEYPESLNDCEYRLHSLLDEAFDILSVTLMNDYFISEGAKKSIYDIDKMETNDLLVTVEAIIYYGNKNNIEIDKDFPYQALTSMPYYETPLSNYIERAFPSLNKEGVDKVKKDISDIIDSFNVELDLNIPPENIKITEEKSPFYVTEVIKIVEADYDHDFDEKNFDVYCVINGTYGTSIFTTL